MLTVTTPPANRRLTTVEAVKAELGITGSAEDARLGALIDRASGMIAEHCGQDFAYAVYAETFRRPLADALMLSRRPAYVATVTADDAALDAAGFEVDGASGLAWRLGAGAERTGWYGQGVSIAYAAGYVLPGDPDIAGVARLPSGVEQAAIMLVTALHAGSGRDPMLRSETVEGVGSTSWIATAEMGALPPQVVDLLARHRRGMWG